MKKFLVASVVMAAAVLLGASSARADIWASDTFTYTDGELSTVSSGTWTIFSGTAGALHVLNNAATITGTGTLDESISLSGTHSSDAVFAGFDADVISWSQASSGSSGYFALFKDASTFNFFARTYVTNVTGGVKFGITTGATQPPIWSSTVSLGTTHRVVIEFDQTGASLGVDATASLYLDGTLQGTSAAVINSNYNISAFGLRQSNSGTEGNLTVDNLVIGDGLAAVPEPSTMALLGFGLVSMLALRRRVSRK
ncbi:MAG: PEP-CTERM sorting domain-containing protein [Verrucomicrobiia bacterium]|jgi:hypothetical protein